MKRFVLRGHNAYYQGWLARFFDQPQPEHCKKMSRSEAWKDPEGGGWLDGDDATILAFTQNIRAGNVFVEVVEEDKHDPLRFAEALKKVVVVEEEPKDDDPSRRRVFAGGGSLTFEEMKRHGIGEEQIIHHRDHDRGAICVVCWATGRDADTTGAES